MEELYAAKKSVRTEEYCVLCTKDLKNRACMWHGMGRNGEKEGGGGGWRHYVTWWEWEDMILLIEV